MKKFFLTASFLFLILSVFGQILKPIEWEVTFSESNPKAGDEVEIQFKAFIEEDWYLYSSDFDPDLGPLVTEFTFEAHDSYELVGDLEPINPKKKYDTLWEGEISYFKKEGVFIQKVKILQDDFQIKGTYFYQVCSDVDGKCIPFEDEFLLGTLI